MGSKKKLIVIKETFKEAGKSLAVKSEIEKLTEIATNLEGEVILLIGSKKLGGAAVSAPIRKLKAVGEFFDIGRLSLSQSNSFVRKVSEKLAMIGESLPPNAGRPTLGPQSSILDDSPSGIIDRSIPSIASGSAAVSPAHAAGSWLSAVSNSTYSSSPR